MSQPPWQGYDQQGTPQQQGQQQVPGPMKFYDPNQFQGGTTSSFPQQQPVPGATVQNGQPPGIPVSSQAHYGAQSTWDQNQWQNHDWQNQGQDGLGGQVDPTQQLGQGDQYQNQTWDPNQQQYGYNNQWQNVDPGQSWGQNESVGSVQSYNTQQSNDSYFSNQSNITDSFNNVAPQSQEMHTNPPGFPISKPELKNDDQVSTYIDGQANLGDSLSSSTASNMFNSDGYEENTNDGGAFSSFYGNADEDKVIEYDNKGQCDTDIGNISNQMQNVSLKEPNQQGEDAYKRVDSFSNLQHEPSPFDEIAPGPAQFSPADFPPLGHQPATLTPSSTQEVQSATQEPHFTQATHHSQEPHSVTKTPHAVTQEIQESSQNPPDSEPKTDFLENNFNSGNQGPSQQGAPVERETPQSHENTNIEAPANANLEETPMVNYFQGQPHVQQESQPLYHPQQPGVNTEATLDPQAPHPPSQDKSHFTPQPANPELLSIQEGSRSASGSPSVQFIVGSNPSSTTASASHSRQGSSNGHDLHVQEPHIQQADPRTQQTDPHTQQTDPHIQQTDPYIQQTDRHSHQTDSHIENPDGNAQQPGNERPASTHSFSSNYSSQSNERPASQTSVPPSGEDLLPGHQGPNVTLPPIEQESHVGQQYSNMAPANTHTEYKNSDSNSTTVNDSQLSQPAVTQQLTSNEPNAEIMDSQSGPHQSHQRDSVNSPEHHMNIYASPIDHSSNSPFQPVSPRHLVNNPLVASSEASLQQSHPAQPQATQSTHTNYPQQIGQTVASTQATQHSTQLDQTENAPQIGLQQNVANMQQNNSGFQQQGGQQSHLQQQQGGQQSSLQQQGSQQSSLQHQGQESQQFVYTGQQDKQSFPPVQGQQPTNQQPTQVQQQMFPGQQQSMLPGQQNIKQAHSQSHTEASYIPSGKSEDVDVAESHAHMRHIAGLDTEKRAPSPATTLWKSPQIPQNMPVVLAPAKTEASREQMNPQSQGQSHDAQLQQPVVPLNLGHIKESLEKEKHVEELHENKPHSQQLVSNQSANASQHQSNIRQQNMIPGQQNMNPGQQTMNPGQQTLNQGQSSMNPGQQTMNQGQPSMNMGQPNTYPGQQNMNLDQQNMNQSQLGSNTHQKQLGTGGENTSFAPPAPRAPVGQETPRHNRGERNDPRGQYTPREQQYTDKHYDPRYSDPRDTRRYNRYEDPRYDSRGYFSAQKHYGHGGYDRPRSRQGEEYERPRSRQGDRPSSRQGYEDRPRSRQGMEVERPRSRADKGEEYYYRCYKLQCDYYKNSDPRFKQQDYEYYYYKYQQMVQYREYYGNDDSEYQRPMEKYNKGYADEWRSYNSADPRADYSGYDAYDRRSQHSSRGGTPAEEYYRQDSYQSGSRPSSRQGYDSYDHRSSSRGAYDQLEPSPIYPADQSGYYQAADGSYVAYGQDGDQSYYGQTEPRVPERSTPVKFSMPHVCASFGPGGQLIKVLPNRPADGQAATVTIHDMAAMIPDCSEAEELRSFPGPLIKGQTHKNDVVSFCQSKIKEALEDQQLVDRESAILVWKLLELLIKQNGTIVGTDIAELLLEGHEPSTKEYLDHGLPIAPSSDSLHDASNVTSTSASMSDISSLAAGIDNLNVTNERTVISKTGKGEDITDRFRHLLLYGRKKDALDWGMKNNLWGHTLFLASKMDARTHASVMTRFANVSMKLNDPLQTLYQMMSNRQPAAVTCVADDAWGDWRPHLAMILSNSSKPDMDRRSITTLGDTLAARGCLYASHFCYLMAQLSFGQYHKKTSKIVLIGSSHSLEFEYFANNVSIQCTEVYEYAQSLGNPLFHMTSFQLYKYLYATRLEKFGLIQETLQYTEHLATTIQQSPGSYDAILVKNVYQLADRLKFHDPQIMHAGEMYEQPSWLENLGKIVHAFEEGNIAAVPASGSQTPMGYGSTTGSDIADVSGITPGADVNMQQYQESFGGQQQQQEQPTEGETAQQEQQKPYRDPNYPGYIYNYQTQQWETDPDFNQGVQGAQQTETTQEENGVEETEPYKTFSKTSALEGVNLAESMNSNYTATTAESTDPDDPYGDSMNSQSTFDYYGASTTTGLGQSSISSTMPLGASAGQFKRPSISESSPPTPTNKLPPSQPPPKPVEPPKEQPKKEAPKKKPAKSGGSSWLGGMFSKILPKGKNEMNLPDDKNPTIIWDDVNKRWVNQDADEEDEKPAGPPPKDSDLSHPSPAPAPAPTDSTDGQAPAPPTGNRFSRPKQRGARGQYVDVMNPGGTSTSSAAPSNLFNVMPTVASMPNMFIPDMTGQLKATSDSGAAPMPSSEQNGSAMIGNPGSQPNTPIEADTPQQMQFFNPHSAQQQQAQGGGVQGSGGHNQSTDGEMSHTSSMSSLSQEVTQLTHSAPESATPTSAAPPPASNGPPMFFDPSTYQAPHLAGNQPEKPGHMKYGQRRQYPK
ncbi:unnamed protein product [Owenia fusiformis]|uniref:Protein transport protein sec16 n=1 Tax=Owenia fusiformis TaxID=6347 RepID=A0A8S4NY23_OWEFU|nr:unnamed protein product [Owenia fusiformis]